MKTPFVYGVAAEEMYFTDRKKETYRLTMNFENGLNTIIISPRRPSVRNRNHQTNLYTRRRMDGECQAFS